MSDFRLYRDLAAWWPLMSAPSEYVEEAAFYTKALIDACERAPRSVLELGSGGGNNASHMKSHFDSMTLVDLSPGMLAHSRALNPECTHIEGDMRTIRLGRQFDAVFVHDAVCHMTTEEDLRRAIETAFTHCRSGGAALFAPDHVRENFQESSEIGGHDDGPRGMRWLEWTWDPDPDDTTYVSDFVYLLRAADGTMCVEHDRHTDGLFSRADWLRWLADAGFQPKVVPFAHSDVDWTLEVFVGVKR